jgi:hypothetical protein
MIKVVIFAAVVSLLAAVTVSTILRSRKALVSIVPFYVITELAISMLLFRSICDVMEARPLDVSPRPVSTIAEGIVDGSCTDYCLSLLVDEGFASVDTYLNPATTSPLRDWVPNSLSPGFYRISLKDNSDKQCHVFNQWKAEVGAQDQYGLSPAAYESVQKIISDGKCIAIGPIDNFANALYVYGFKNRFEGDLWSGQFFGSVLLRSKMNDQMLDQSFAVTGISVTSELPASSVVYGLLFSGDLNCQSASKRSNEFIAPSN